MEIADPAVEGCGLSGCWPAEAWLLNLRDSLLGVVTMVTHPQYTTQNCAPLLFQGCDPLALTQRSKLQHRRARINQQINKEMRMRAGAENLFR